MAKVMPIVLRRNQRYVEIRSMGNAPRVLKRYVTDLRYSQQQVEGAALEWATANHPNVPAAEIEVRAFPAFTTPAQDQPAQTTNQESV